MVAGQRVATRFRSFSTANKNLIKRLDKLIRVFDGKRHWWPDLDHVVEWSFRAHQYAALTHLIYDGARVFSELDAQEKAGAADFADLFVTRMQVVEASE